MLDWRLYGAAPAGHHATSVALHAANTARVFALFTTMTAAPWRSALVAALFGLHPLRVESVAWVAERKDVLSAFFWLLTTLAYVWYTRAPSLRRGALVALGLALGLMAKPMLVTLPATLLLLDYWPLRRLGSRRDLWPRVREKLPLIPLVLAVSFATIVAQGDALGSLESFSLAARLENAIGAYAVYLWQLVWPMNLYIPRLHSRGSIPLGQVVAAAAVLIAVTAGAIRVRASHPYVLVGWLWCVGTLLPVIGLMQAGEQAMADRFTYVPMIGVVAALVWLVPARAGTPATVVAALVLVLLTVRTRSQIAVWRDPVTLFEHTLAVDERNPIAHSNLGYALGDRGDLEGASRHFQRTLELRPHSPRAIVGLGNVLVSRDRTDEAITQYRAALAMEPDSKHALANLGYSLAREGRNDEAVGYYQQALAVDPYFAVAHKYLGVALANQGRAAEALAHFEESVRWDARDPDALNDLGVALMSAGRVTGGRGWGPRARAHNPRVAGAHTTRIPGLYPLGRAAEAWGAVGIARAAGVEPPAALLAALAAKTPEPRP
jgi:Flp pilus assembly protein TadD